MKVTENVQKITKDSKQIMKPNLAQLLNCTHIPYGCLLIET
jgi:hypothetical protein